MESDFSTALSLLAIGMITVFVVLMLVVAAGKLMIRVSNRFDEGDNEQKIPSHKIAAITAAVETFTDGKGRITKIEKV